MEQAEIWLIVSRIVVQFPLLECDQCVLVVMRWLRKQGIEGKIIRLRTKRRTEMFITSDRYGSNESITENGTHYGVEVLGKVFDNLSSEGLPREEWIRDFNCPSGEFVVDELTTISYDFNLKGDGS